MDSTLAKLEQNATTSGDEQLAKKIEIVPEADLDDVDGAGYCGGPCVCVPRK